MKLNLDYCLRPFNADRRDHQVSLLMTYDILRRPPVTNTRTVTNREMIERIVTNRETVERTVTNHSGPVRAAAALDFRNLSGRNDLDHLGTAIPEALASWLNEHCGLAVIDRSTAMKKAGSETAFTLESVPTGERQALAERIGASCVISGSFTEVDNEIQISASLTDLTTGEVKTTVTRRGTMGRDIFTVLDGLAEELCGKINRLNETTGSP
jgi:TolB-like protein